MNHQVINYQQTTNNRQNNIKKVRSNKDNVSPNYNSSMIINVNRGYQTRKQTSNEYGDFSNLQTVDDVKQSKQNLDCQSDYYLKKLQYLCCILSGVFGKKIDIREPEKWLLLIRQSFTIRIR